MKSSIRSRIVIRAAVCVVGALVIATGCRVTFLPGDDGGFTIGGQTTLDRAEAVLSIIQTANSSRAQVRMALETPAGSDLILSDEQSLQVNGSTLREESAGLYTREIDAADTYRVTVGEPTRGVQTTSIDGPAAFSISNPPSGGEASLSGFTVMWTGANADLEVVVRVSQTIFDDTETETFTLDSDEGMLELSANDLRDFVQGADLDIEVTKISRGGDIDGLGATTIRIERARLRSAEPTP